MDKKGQRSSNFENKQIDEVFWRRSFNELPTINEDNETLLFDNFSSSSSSSYKEVQNSVKIPKEEKDFTGNQVLSDSDTVEDFETEFQKNVDKQYFEKPNIQYDDDAASLASNFGSLEGLSLLNEEVCCVDQDEVSNVDDDNESLISIDKFILSLPVDDEIFYAHLPAINRDPTAAVPLQNIEKDFEDKLVYISEIFDPAHFWFQFVVGDEKFENFDKFHAKLNDDYNKLKDRELLIADKNFQEGLIVVAYVKQYEKWFRAKIIKNYDGKKKYVRLFFIDYGTNGTCEKSNIRYLFNYFMKYPKYCFRGRLHGIVPLNNERSFEISQIEEFLKKISNYTTYATAIKYEAEDDVYQLKLVRRKRCIDMYEYMIEHKLGQNIFPWDNDGEFSIGPPCYLIPSFQNLEYDYPTYAQIAIMKKFEIDYNWLINSNHLLCYRRKDIEGNEDLKMLLKQPEFATLKDYFYGR